MAGSFLRNAVRGRGRGFAFAAGVVLSNGTAEHVVQNDRTTGSLEFVSEASPHDIFAKPVALCKICDELGRAGYSSDESPVYCSEIRIRIFCSHRPLIADCVFKSSSNRPSNPCGGKVVRSRNGNPGGRRQLLK
jgi:hypothetical protein